MDLHAIHLIAEMHAVYRMFDEERNLLYIGRTGNAGKRFGDHNTKRWFPLVATIELEWHPTHAVAVAAEERAILAEQPRYNVIGKMPESRRAVPPRRRPKSACRPAVAPVPATQVEIPEAARQAIGMLLVRGTTISEVASVVRVTKWTARVWLERLREDGTAEVVGYKRTARWREVRELKSAVGG